MSLPVSLAPPYRVTLVKGRVGELRLGELTKAADGEKDPQKKRALMDSSREKDVVVRADTTTRNGRVVHEIRILGDDSRVRTVQIDAQSTVR